MDGTERPQPLLLGIFALVLLVGIVSMVRAVFEGWDMWRNGIRETVWILPGGLLIGGSLAWSLLIILQRQAHPRIPRPSHGSISLETPTSMRRASIVALLGLALMAVGTVGVVARGTSSSEVPMTAYRWLLVVALLAVFFGLLLILAAYGRLARVRFVADHKGLAWNGLLRQTRIELPWMNIKRIELQGRWLQRTVVVTEDGRTLHPILWDPSIPMSRDAAGRVVAEIEGLRPGS